MVEDIDSRYKILVQRRNDLHNDKTRIEAELEARKRNLKAQMEAAKKEGFDPNNLAEEIRRNEEVLIIKLDNFETELNEAEKIMRPMLEEIKGG